MSINLEAPARADKHHLVIRQLGGITRAECSCGAWMEDREVPHWAPEPDHAVHVHLAQLTDKSADAHMEAIADVIARTDAALQRMLAAGKLD